MTEGGGAKHLEGDPSSKQPVLQGAALDEALEDLCARRQTLYLATPYFSFESRFLERIGPDLKIRATMSRNAVQHTLAKAALRLRFPWGLTQLGGPTRVLDYEEAEGGRFLRLAVPPALSRDDQRRACRLERTGRSTGVLGSRDLTLVKCTLESLSTLGTGVFCMEPLPADGFQMGQPLDLSLSLEQGPEIQARARVCHCEGQALGLSFSPPLSGATMDLLTAWLQPRLEAAQRQWEDRASLRSQAERAARPRPAPQGILLASGDPDLRTRVGSALEELPLRWVWPALAPFREALETQPPRVLLLVLSGGMEESHRLRTLLEAVPPQAPMLALGIGSDLDQARALAIELKATLFVDRRTLESNFFKRLVLGLIRKHWPNEAPQPEP
jgi:hypothetical protein